MNKKISPDCLSNYCPNTGYLRELIAAAGMTQSASARAVGIQPRALRTMINLADSKFRSAPYAVQFALERLSGLSSAALNELRSRYS